MSEENAGLQAEPDGSAATPGSDAAAPESSQASDPNDFEGRIRNDPDFALAEFKKQQAAASRANDLLRKGNPVLEAARLLGQGNVEVGANAVLGELQQLRALASHPALGPLVQRFLRGEQIDQSALSANGSDDLGFDEDPTDQKLRALTGTVTRLEREQTRRELSDHLRKFTEGPIGQHLTDEEKNGVMDAVANQIQLWGATDAGRAAIQSMNYDVIRSLAVNHLGEDRLLEVASRRARQQAAQLRERETDGPSRIQSSAAPGKPAVDFDRVSIRDAALEAVRAAKRELGLR